MFVDGKLVLLVKSIEVLVLHESVLQYSLTPFYTAYTSGTDIARSQVNKQFTRCKKKHVNIYALNQKEINFFRFSDRLDLDNHNSQSLI